MTRYHTTPDGNIPFTAEEEAARDAEEAAWVPDYTTPTQRLLDKEANRLGYDNIQSAISYVGDLNQDYHNEGIAFRNWRSEVWSTHNTMLNDIKNGSEKLEVRAFIALLPPCPI